MVLMHAIVRVTTRWIPAEEWNEKGELKDPASMGPDYVKFEALAAQYGVEICDSGEIAESIDEEWHVRDYVVDVGNGGIENFAEFLVNVYKFGDEP